jgi:hypothetical protein
MKCSKYPDREAAGFCAYSGRPFCAEELVDLGGRLYAKDHLIQLAAAREQERPPRFLTTNPFVSLAAFLVFSICTYVFLLGNDCFSGQFKNEPLGWYFFAKGIFCALSLYLTQNLLQAVRDLRG